MLLDTSPQYQKAYKTVDDERGRDLLLAQRKTTK